MKKTPIILLLSFLVSCSGDTSIISSNSLSPSSSIPNTNGESTNLITTETNSSPVSSLTNLVTITFDSRGGTSISPLQIESNSLITIPNVVNAGHTLDGWYTSLNGGMTFDVKWNFFSDRANFDFTLYASWIINQYTISFESNGGNLINSITDDYGVNLTNPSPTKVGHTFAGWFTDVGLTQTFTMTTMPASNLTLYAKWTINQYTITFETNGGSSITSITGNYGASVSVSNDPTREGYTFSGWYANANLTQAASIPNAIPAQNQTLYAKWVINQYTITFNTNSGDSISTQTNTYNSSLSVPNATRVGYTFAGWYTDDGLTQAFTMTTMPASNLTLYAKWTINQYTISFNSMLLTPFAKVETGPNNSFAITSLGQIYSWGSDLFGQLGSGDSRYFPEKIIFPDLLLGEMITEISANANGSHTLALSNIGRVYAWGRNQFGRLGDGTDINRGTPVLTNFTSSGLMESEKIVTIKAAQSHSIALTNQGRIFVWGDNSYGQIGDGRSSAVYYPKLLNLELQENEKTTQIEVGDNHNVILTSNSRIFTWGSNSSSQLGDGTTIDKKVPTLVSNAFLSENESITKIYSGSYYNFLTTSNGKVYGWGGNSYGVLGNGTQDYLLQPTLITFNNLLNFETFVSFDLGIYHSLGITNLGNIYSWGRNTLGRLGNGTNVDSYSPVLVLINQLIENEYIVDFSAGFSHSLVLTNIGRTIVWGYNGYGQLGDGSNINKVNPLYLTNDYFESGGFSANYTEVTYNTIILLENPLMEGYVFDGWYQDEELLLVFDIMNMPAENLTIYAKFIPN